MPQGPRNNQKTCSICLDSPRHPACLDSCRHTFCHSCIRQWSQNQNTCPVCRKEFTKITSKRRNRSGSVPNTRRKASASTERRTEVSQRSQRNCEDEVEQSFFSVFSRPMTRHNEEDFLQLFGFLERVIED